MNYLGNALRQQKLKQTQMRKHLLDLFFSFLAGLGLGICFGIEYVVKFFN